MNEQWEPLSILVDNVINGRQSARSLVERALSASKEKTEYNAVITLIEEVALKRADEIDLRIKNGERIGRLAGVPFMAKDNYLTQGVETTAGSNILRGYIPPYSSTVIERLEAEGAVLVAKTNLDAFAHGSSTENSDFGPTLNPVDKTRVAGGSSGGSATAVALGLVPFAVGTDTGGSIRLPASFCGVVGVKPTYGLIPRYGVVAMASSTDCMGPLTNNVADSALLLDIMAGPDGHDATAIDREDSYLPLSADIAGKKVGIIKEFFGEGLDAGVRTSVERAIDRLRELGADVKEVSIPSISLALAVYYIVVPAEVSSNLSRYDGVRYGPTEPASDLKTLYEQTRSQGFNAENKRRIMMGTYVLSSGYYDAYYKKAQTVRTKLINEFKQAFEQVELLVGPTAPTTAFKLGDNTDDPLKMYLSDIMTVAANLVGNPSLSLPIEPAEGLPVGLQIMADQRQDKLMLSAAMALEGKING